VIDIREPRFECDLIMKGGITSGIVYPPAVVEIAKDHRFRSIGGSSAGAIAAASTAAAELGRRSASGGFELLSQLPAKLAEVDGSGRTRLQRLFQADDATADVFDLAWSVRSTKGRARVTGAIRALRGHGKVPSLVDLAGFVAVAIATGLVIATAVTGQWWGFAAAAALFVIAVVGWLGARSAAQAVTGAVALAGDTPGKVAANGHGLCSGLTPKRSSDPALTDWLHDTLQALAGRNDASVASENRGKPVTYGELRGAGIELVTMTTDVTHGTAEMLPLDAGIWAFSEAELRAVLPGSVVDHMVANPAEVTDATRASALAASNLIAFPSADDQPIVLGARASLSFPILLSAVPLYQWAPQSTEAGWDMQYVKTWLSDGGITSNLPVHLFDAPLPGRPTYAINLSGGGEPNAADANIWRPLLAGAGRHPDNGVIDSTKAFMSAVFDTMQNWSDNSLIHAPGYRDRICTVRLGTGEGGMNLDMKPETIKNLAERGTLAGYNLAWIQRGDPGRAPVPPGISADVLKHQWDRHRFTRYRTFLAGLSRYLTDAHTGFDGVGQYSALGDQAVHDTWFPYRKGWASARATAVEQDLHAMFDVDLPPMAVGAPAGSALGFNPRAARIKEQAPSPDN
jgi:predicted acylesterase/phospholipase RssA